MTETAPIITERLILRSWRDDDLEPFAAMCADPRVMATLGPLLDREGTAAVIARVKGFDERLGYTFWAVERREDGAFLGWCGVKPGAENTPLEGEIEIGWRLAHEYWGKGYAREAAQATLEWVWANLDVPAVAAMTTPGNTASWGLMERLGMTRIPEDDFDHPNLAPGDPLRPHITYRINRSASVTR